MQSSNENAVSMKRSGAQRFALWLILFLCVYIPFRRPIASIIEYFVWYNGYRYSEMSIADALICAFPQLRSILVHFTDTLIFSAVTDILVAILFVWHSIEIRLRYKMKAQDWFFIGFLAVAFISTMFVNHSGAKAYIVQVRSIALFYIVYFVIRNYKWGKCEFIKLAKMLGTMAVVLFALAMVEIVTSKTLLFPMDVAQSIIFPVNFARAYSMFYNPNTFGAFILLTYIVCISASYLYEYKTNPAIYVSLLVSLIFSMSRSTIIIFVVMNIVLAILYYRSGRVKNEWKKMLVKAGIIALCTVVLYAGSNVAKSIYYDCCINTSASSEYATKVKGSLSASVGARMNDLKESGTYTQSASDGRMFSVKTGLRVMKDHPLFGSGFGTYGSAASLSTVPTQYEKYEIPEGFYSDCQYICIMAETGILGTLVFAGFLISILISYRKNLMKILVCVVIGWLGIFYNIFEVQIAAFLFWIFLAFYDSEGKFDTAKLVFPKKENDSDESADCGE